MGVCSGIVTRRDGSPARGVRVRGEVRGLSGGMTASTTTDRDGRFVLEWSSSDGLATLYVDGRSVERNVRNGAKVHARI